MTHGPVVDQRDLEGIADPAVQRRADRAAVVRPALLPDAGRHLECDLLDGQRDAVHALVGQGCQHRVDVGAERGVRVGDDRGLGGVGRTVLAMAPRLTGPVHHDVEDHAQLPVSGDRAPALHRRTDDPQVEFGPLARQQPRRGASGDRQVVHGGRIVVHQFDDKLVTGVDADLVRHEDHVAGADLHPDHFAGGLHLGLARRPDDRCETGGSRVDTDPKRHGEAECGESTHQLRARPDFRRRHVVRPLVGGGPPGSQARPDA